jgi:two-component system KDP operon response regulator KdpE
MSPKRKFVVDQGVKILIVDDERPIRRFLRASLISHGHDVHEAETGFEALKQATKVKPDLIILDLGLPDMDGLEVTRRLREWTTTPIIILSVREKEEVKIAALEAGADDYLTKPFGIGELIARIKVALRHTFPVDDHSVFQTGSLQVDLAGHLVFLAGKNVSLTPTEFQILRVLVWQNGKVVTQHQLLREVWGDAYSDESHLLRVNISNLRRKLEPDPAQPKYLLTETGVGYRIKIEL